LGGVIAKGTYSVVRTATHLLTGRKVAVKTYLKTSLSNQDRIRNLEQELQILSMLRHPLILRLD
jgi:serine/threonine protein kinase